MAKPNGKPQRLEATLAVVNGWREAFLDHFERTGNLTQSARAAGVTRSAVYEAMKRDPAFAEKVQDAFDALLDNLEGKGFERALNGSDGLLMFMLRSHRRRVYGDKKEVTVNTGGADREFINYMRSNFSVDAARELRDAAQAGRKVEHVDGAFVIDAEKWVFPDKAEAATGDTT